MRTLGIVVLGLAVVYLVGVNTLLRTRLLRKIVTYDPDKLRLEYTSAYSLVPGQVHVEGLTLRGRDSSVEWNFGIDRCTFWFVPGGLFHKTFHAVHIRADGLTMRLRKRLKTLPPARDLEALPAIPGFPSPSFAPPPGPPPALNKLWTVQLEDAHAEHVREVWVDTLRVTGDEDVRGRWLFRPKQKLEIGPAHITVASTDVGHGDRLALGSGIRGDSTVTVPLFDLRELQHGSFLPHLSVHGGLQGTAYPAALLLPLKDQGVALDTVDAPARVRLEVDHGVLRPGTEVATEPVRATLHAGDFTFAGTVTPRMQVDDGGTLHAEARTTGLRVTSSASERAKGSAVVVSVVSRELDLASPFHDATVEAEARGLETSSLPYWASRIRRIPKNVRVEGGELRGDARATGRLFDALRGDISEVTSDLRARRLDVRTRDLQILSATAVDLRLRRLSIRRGSGDLSGSRVTTNDAKVTLTKHGSTAEAELFRATAYASRLAFVRGRARAAVEVDVPEVRFPDLASLAAALVPSRIFRVQGGHATAKANFALDSGRHEGRAIIDVRADGMQVAAGDRKLQGTVRMTVDARGPWDAIDLSQTTLSFRSDPSAPSGWWADVRLLRATLAVRRGTRADLGFVAAAQDASPITAMVAKKSSVPQWLLNSIPLRSLNVSGEVLAAPSSVVVPSVHAESSGSHVEFCYARASDKPDRWGLLLDTGAVHLGVHGGQGGGVVPVEARSWFEHFRAQQCSVGNKGEAVRVGR